MQIYWNKRKCLHKKRVQLPQDWFGTTTWPPFHCFGTPIWPPWRHVKTLYRQYPQTTLLRRLEKTDYGTMYAYITTKRKRGWRGERHCQCWNTENRENVVVLVVFNVRGKGGNWGNFFFFGAGGGGTVQFTPANTTHEKPKVGRAHFFSRAFAFSYEVALSLPFDNAELWVGSFFASFSFFSPSFS